MKYLSLVAFLVLAACTQNQQPTDMLDDDTIGMEDQEDEGTKPGSQDTVTFLALGDSYTIGERVDVSDRWPVQLATVLNDYEFKVAEPRIVARTGWTTDELKAAIVNEDLNKHYDMVSLLIGVNNQYRGYPIDQYAKEFEELLDQALAFSGDPKKTFVVSIPDYGVTPFGQSKDPERIATELDTYNGIAQSIANGKGVQFFNITPISRRAAIDPNLVAQDGLHPSGKMYKEWVDLITPWARDILAE